MRISARVACAVVCVACGRGDARSPEVPATPNAVTYRSCGPTDGPGRTIVITDGPVDCAFAEHRTMANITIELWSSQVLDGGSGVLDGNSGDAMACTGTGECRKLTGATVSVHGEADGTLAGSVTYRDGGQSVTRAFRASSCTVPMTCG